MNFVDCMIGLQIALSILDRIILNEKIVIKDLYKSIFKIQNSSLFNFDTLTHNIISLDDGLQ